ncbi:MAG: PTS sugar transporter subunit IIA [Zetaproteobacteria bacterium]|nr:MAG: PTS sugar transporter subunit IIA [Zetaproteobacteria bacterium]
MIGILLVGHAQIGREMIHAVEHVLGPQPCLASVDTGPEQNLQAMRKALDQAIRLVDSGHGVLILIDIFGGTPCNLVLEACTGRGKIRVVSGYNLPLLIKALSLRANETDLDTLARKAIASGKRYMSMTGVGHDEITADPSSGERDSNA